MTGTNHSASLFHYTKFNNLYSVLQNGLLPNYCQEVDICNPTLVLGIPMVSFCDIPLSQIQEFAKRYGRHAIGFSKNWARKFGINPIWYVNDKLKIDNVSDNVKAYIKPFSNTKQTNYIENEWRYVVNDVKWLDSKQYFEWRGDKNKAKPKPSANLQRQKLTFEVSDISVIVVEQQNQVAKLINKIQNIKAIGGGEHEISTTEKDELISKILSMELIKKDF